MRSIRTLAAGVACLAALLAPPTLSASAAEPAPPENLYVRSLRECIRSKVSQGEVRDAIVVFDNHVTSDPAIFYPRLAQVDSVRIEYLDPKALKQRFDRTRKPFAVIEVKPIINGRGVLVVRCYDLQATVRRRKLMLHVRKGTSILWRFDATLGDYNLAEVRQFRLEM